MRPPTRHPQHISISVFGQCLRQGKVATYRTCPLRSGSASAIRCVSVEHALGWLFTRPCAYDVPRVCLHKSWSRDACCTVKFVIWTGRLTSVDSWYLSVKKCFSFYLIVKGGLVRKQPSFGPLSWSAFTHTHTIMSTTSSWYVSYPSSDSWKV